MKFCERCGTQLADSAKYCSACGCPCKPAEAQNAIRFCINCGVMLKEEDRYCPECGKPCSTPANGKNTKRKGIPLLLLAACLILWCGAPFAAGNLLTWGEQSTALQIVTGGILYVGELRETAAFWAAIASVVGIAVCVLSVLAAANCIARIAALLTEIPLGWALFAFAQRADGAEALLEAFGIGFWGIFVLFLLIACISRSGADGRTKANTRDDGALKSGSVKRTYDKNAGSGNVACVNSIPRAPP